jgi:hypothetical protein
MKHRLQDALSRLALVEYQRRYIAQGTRDEYVLPEELLEDAESVARLALMRSSLPEAERQAVERFLEAASLTGSGVDSALKNQNTSSDDLIENNPAWINIREAARACLGALEMPVQDIERL